MLNAVSSLTGFRISAKDGSLGTVSDFLFDDSTWKRALGGRGHRHRG